jgi:hypothetical protein
MSSTRCFAAIYISMLTFLLHVTCRLKVEKATLMESVGTVDHLTSSVHRLHVVLLKV